MADDIDDSDARDRAAILARRQRFIALALTGFAAACGDDAASPTPCLDVAPQTESSSVTGPTDGDATADSTGGQQPCLGAIPETSSSDSSGAAESTTSTGTDSGETTGTGEGTSTGSSSGDSDGAESSGSSTGMPLPCLAPKP